MKTETPDIKKHLPNGAIKEIARIAKVNYNTVSLYFRGKPTKHESEILGAVKTFIEQSKAQKQELDQLKQELVMQLAN